MTNGPDSLIPRWFCDAETLAAMAPTPQAQAAIRQMLELGKDYAALAQQFVPLPQAPGITVPQQPGAAFAARYLALFAPAEASISGASGQGASSAAAVARYQCALQAHGQALAAIAQRASALMTASLADEAGPPIRSLRELHLLWIDCGERAFAQAAHGEEFAATQAELLAAYVELRA